MSDPIHSTGRGGAGNIGPDTTAYTDGGIIREGVQGESADGAYSTGRGGTGNIGMSPRLNPQEGIPRRSQDIIPETALREHQENFHTGRGGEGNIHKDKYGGHSHSPDRKGVVDKVKHVLHLDKDKKPASPLASESKD
ncbi:uncharacterized protein BDR25DRAFT_305092 [Lindgomyces ingoldianus]|uniref:Uncharacterized protein n=1 Tax=Lindgomyces ingoldianus TaxID=673940 RepID=A0ACB6QMD1_9PLEO|nr:uncharacterized protein BDR25DRAFT_305092 [Lindgomyces ingoldianus]KAF2468056.1 hypothetical protein BDR25DRAFT_305092 [Lindgomyces ingoldianus]